jgi:hypothetical protein
VHCIVESSRANDDTEREISRQYAERFPLKTWSADADPHARSSPPAAIAAASPPRTPLGPCEDGRQSPPPEPPLFAATSPAPARSRPAPRPWSPAELRRAYGDLPAGAARMLLRACLRRWGPGSPPASAAAAPAAPASPAAAAASLGAAERARAGPRGAVADDEASAAPPPVGSAPGS